MKFYTLVIMITMAVTACQKQSPVGVENRTSEKTTLQMESLSAVNSVATPKADGNTIPSPTELVEKDLLASFQADLKAKAKSWSQQGFDNLLNSKIADDDDVGEATKEPKIIAAKFKTYENRYVG